MILPLIFFIALELIVHTETIKTIASKMTANYKADHEPVPTTSNNNDIPMVDVGLFIDMRKNTTVC